MWQSDAKKFIKPEKDVIFAWCIDGQGEHSFRFFRVPATDLPKLLQKNLDEHERLEVIGENLHDHNVKHKYPIIHISIEDLER